MGENLPNLNQTNEWDNLDTDNTEQMEELEGMEQADLRQAAEVAGYYSENPEEIETDIEIGTEDIPSEVSINDVPEPTAPIESVEVDETVAVEPTPENE